MFSILSLSDIRFQVTNSFHISKSLANQLMEGRNDIVLSDLSNFLGSNVQVDGSQHPQDESNHHEFSLPPADRGKDAVLFLVAGFVVEALVWGKCNLFHSFPASDETNGQF
jgi:hypothetical protein